jgi:Domain of unknown function (DUF5615)
MQLYADENFPLPVVEELRRMGHDVLTAQEDGRQSAPDPDILIALTRSVVLSSRTTVVISNDCIIRVCITVASCPRPAMTILPPWLPAFMLPSLGGLTVAGVSASTARGGHPELPSRRCFRTVIAPRVASRFAGIPPQRASILVVAV